MGGCSTDGNILLPKVISATSTSHLDATEVSNSDTASSTSPVLQFSLSSKIEPEIFEREKSKEEALHDIEYWNDLKEALHARHVPS